MAHIKMHKGRTRPYEVRWSEYRNGKRMFYSESFRRQKDAENFMRQKEDQAATGSILINPKGGKAPLSKWAEEWFAQYQRTVKPSTARKSRGLLNATVVPMLGHRQIRAIRAADVADWLHEIEQTRNISPATVKHHYLVLRSVLQYAAQNGAIAVNPAVGVRLPTNRTRGRLAHRAHFLTNDEVDALASLLDYPYNVLVPFMAWTGLRAAEVAGLNIGDVDLTRDVLTVERTRTRVKGGAWEVHVPKSGERREVPIAALHDDLTAYLAQHPHRHNPDAPLWPGRKITGHTRDGNTSGLDYDAPWDRGPFYRTVFQPALKAAGLPAVRLHDLRHTFASLCASSGIKPAQVAEWMGHRNVTVTLTIYTHLFKEDTTQAAAALAAARTTRHTNATNVVPLHSRRTELG